MLIQDIRYSLRRLAKSPGFAATAVLTLALGMGATTAMYSVIHAVLLNSLPFSDPGRLYVIREAEKANPMSVAWPNFVDWRSQQQSFEALAAYRLQHFDFFDGTHATLPRAEQVTSGFFSVLGAKPVLGRVFTSADDQPGAAPVVVLGDHFWRNQLHSDANMLGKSIDLSGKPYTVIGVMAPEFRFSFGRPEDFYVPLGPEAGNAAFNSRTAHGSVNVIARPRVGVSADAARAEMEGIAARLAAEYPATNAGHSIRMYKLEEAYFASIRPVLWLLMAAVVIVLLVGCANVSNLLLTRGADREREYAIRSALGATGARIFQQSFAESLCLAVLAGIGGVLIAYAALPFLLRLGPSSIPRLHQTALKLPVLAFSFIAALLVSLICGILPGWATMHIAPEQALRGHSASAYAGRGRQMLRSGLLVAGVAITVILSAGTGLLLRSLRQTLATDPGFRPEHLLSLDIVLSGDKYQMRKDTNHSGLQPSQAFFTSAEEKLRALPGVVEAGAVCSPPFAGECGDYFYSIPGRTQFDDADLPDAMFNVADAGYFRVSGIHFKSGRSFLPTDNASSPHVAIINHTFARQWWPNGDAVGHSIHFGGRGEPGDLLEVVGVIDDVKQEGLDIKVEPEIIFPAAQHAVEAMVLLLRTQGNPESLSASAEAAIQTIDKEVPVRIHPMSYYIAQTLRQRQFLTLLLSIFAGLAIFLAALGMFGVAAYSVASRKAEIAVRLALGAPPETVKRWITAQMIRRVALGCAVGIAASLFSARVVRDLLYGVSPTDPVVLAGTCAVLIAVALLATWIPARRAAAVDPMQTLRAE
jgi:putative ABC transport system permease protein